MSLSLLITAGCTPILKEVRHTGGYPGYLLDRRTFDASENKKLVLLRATLILAMAADMGRSTVSGKDADGFAQLLASGVEEINYAAGDIFGDETEACLASQADAPPADDVGCVGFRENFESNLPQIEGRIIKVMLAALPTDRARKFLDDVAKGNVLGAAWSALGSVAATMNGLHVAFARYRSGLETVAGSLAACPAGGDPFSAESGTVLAAARCLGLSERDLMATPPENLGSKLREAKVSERAFLMLMRGIAADCVSLDFSGKGDDLSESQKTRAKSCNSIGFAPQARPFRFDSAYNVVVGSTAVPADQKGDPLDTAAASPPKTPPLDLTPLKLVPAVPLSNVTTPVGTGVSPKN